MGLVVLGQLPTAPTRRGSLVIGAIWLTA